MFAAYVSSVFLRYELTRKGSLPKCCATSWEFVLGLARSRVSYRACVWVIFKEKRGQGFGKWVDDRFVYFFSVAIPYSVVISMGA